MKEMLLLQTQQMLTLSVFDTAYLWHSQLYGVTQVLHSFFTGFESI